MLLVRLLYLRSVLMGESLLRPGLECILDELDAVAQWPIRLARLFKDVVQFSSVLRYFATTVVIMNIIVGVLFVVLKHAEEVIDRVVLFLRFSGRPLIICKSVSAVKRIMYWAKYLDVREM